MLAPSNGGLILYQAYGNLYAMTGRKPNKQIPSVEVFRSWKTFGRIKRDLGSFGEETDKSMDLHQHCSRISLQWSETAFQIQRDAVTTMIKTASQDLKTTNYGVLGRYVVSVSALTKDLEGNKLNTPYPERPIRRIEDIVCEDSGRYQAWSLLQEIPNTSTYSLPSDTAYPLPSDTAYPTFCPIQLRMTKVIKGEFEKLEDLNVEDVSLTCDTSLEVFNNEFNRLSRIDDDLFTYEVEVANIPCESNMDDDSEHEADDDMGYDLSDVAFTEWLGNDEVELTDEESSDNEDDVVEVFRIDTNIFDYETPLLITEYLVNISKRRAFWSLNEDILKITILTTNTSYLSRRIRRIRACTHQRPQRKQAQYAVSREIQYAVFKIMDDLNITMEECIRLEEEKAPKRGKVFNWETTKYGKIWYDEDLHDLRSVETEFPAIAFNDEDNDDDKVDIEHSPRDLSVKPLPD
ncbi:hypothetical protein Tco_0944112 [Tanacetum coccineum]